MSRVNKTSKLLNQLPKTLICFIVMCLLLISGTITYGQETIGELTTQMGIEGELQGQGPDRNPAAPKNEKPSADKQGMEKLDKMAQKLMQSMQAGQYDQPDFSPVWNTLIPPNTNFSDGLNAMVKPIFDQFGKPEKLGQGIMAGNNRAVFPVQFTNGTLNMTVSLDAQDKIQEWTLLTTTAPAATMPNETTQNNEKAESQTSEAEQSKDINNIDIKDFNAFQRELNRINIETKGEEEQWLAPIEKKADLARSIDELYIAQLRFIRKLAESENSEQTIKAVDLVIKQRQQLLNKLITKLEDAGRQERQQQTVERREPRTPRRSTGTMGEPGQMERPAPRTPQRRPARDANTPAQPY